jgi:hypothetical protein
MAHLQAVVDIELMALAHNPVVIHLLFQQLTVVTARFLH